jgi:glycosyltransferase involved in cell wall biosynthesis
MKRVTIITSLYKASPYLQGFLEDITKQTFFSKCTLFLVNANSPDDEDEIVKPFLYEYANNIIYEKLDKDPGLYQCWNYIVKNSNTEYLTNANVDDKMFPTCIEEHVNLLDSKPEIDLAYCYNAISHDPNLTYKDLPNNTQIFPTAPYSLPLLQQANLPHNHPVWRSSLHEKHGYFSNDYASGGDWEFFLRCGVGGAKMELIEKVLGVYYKNPEGVSTKEENMERNLKEVMEIRKKYAT